MKLFQISAESSQETTRDTSGLQYSQEHSLNQLESANAYRASTQHYQAHSTCHSTHEDAVESQINENYVHGVDQQMGYKAEDISHKAPFSQSQDLEIEISKIPKDDSFQHSTSQIIKISDSQDMLDKSTADSLEIDSLGTDSMLINFDSLSSLVKLKRELEKRHINLNNITKIFTAQPECGTYKASQSQYHIKQEAGRKRSQQNVWSQLN